MMCFSCGTCTSKCMIQEKLDPNYNPRRLIRKAIFNLEEEAFADNTTWLCTACELCFSACPQKIHISGVINAVKALALESGQKTFIRTAMVDQQTCVACGLCEAVCPYEAITLKPTKIPFRGVIPVATVDAGRCMACGLCTAACRSNSIRLTEQKINDQDLVESLWSWMQKEEGIR